MPKVLVTGGAGFIGSHVVERFLEQGDDVTVVDDLSSGLRANVPRTVPLHVIDIASPAAADVIRSGRFDVIAHFAAQMDVRASVANPLHDATVNVIGTINVLEAVRAAMSLHPCRVVFASTGGAFYGTTTVLPTPESCPANPDSPYGIAKVAVEHYLAYYGRIWGMKTISLRFGNVYGPRQTPHGGAGVVSIFLGRILSGNPILVYGTGDHTRDYIYIDDVADAFVAAATQEMPPPGDLNARAFNIGTEVATSITELIGLLEEATGITPRIEYLPPRPGETLRSMLDATKIRSQLGWKPRVELRDGLSRTMAWVRGLSPDAKLPGRGGTSK